MKYQLLTLVVTATLSGCSLFSGGYRDSDAQATVADLEPAQLPTVPATDAGKNRAAAMRHYQAFLDESDDNTFVPEAIRRLADLHLENEQDALLEGTLAPGDSKAAQLYAELLKRFPDHGRNDSALYQLARANEQTGEIEPSMAALTRYSDNYKGSGKYDEVQFRRGEYLFVRREYRQAEIAYQAVLDRGESSDFHQQALYKIGWARFKLNHYDDALNAYMQLLDETIGEHNTAELPDGISRSDKERINDTLRAVSLSFSYLGGTNEIRNYYTEHGTRTYEPLIYANLAALHLNKERYTDAAETYSLFANAHPNHPEAPLFQSSVIDVYKKAGFSKRVLKEKQAYIERYEPAAAYWKQHDPAKSKGVLQQVQRHLRDVAQHYHALAQVEKKPKTYADAGHWYQLYLRAFPQSEQAPYMNFLYAELLTSAGQHGLAANQYEQTAYMYGTHRKAAEAGYAALLAYQKHEPTLRGRAKTDWHRKGINSSLRFAGEFPDHKQALPARTLASQQLYALKDYSAAVAAAKPVIDNPNAPKKLQLSAWTVTAHAEFDQSDFQRAELAYQQVLARTPRNDKQRSKLQEKLAATIYKQGEQEKIAGNMAGAAEHFLRITKVVPGSNINVTAQYDAAAAYIALKQWPAAIRILERWRRSNPKNKLQPDVTRKLAVLYQENNQPLQAAGEFARIADTEKDPRMKREATLTTATLYQQAGRDKQAIDAYKRFIKRYPQPLEAAMEARYQLVLLYGKNRQTGKQRYWQKQLVEADRVAGRQRNQRTRYLAAHAQLALVGDMLRAYQQVQLKEPLKKNLARKKKTMQAAIKGYTQAAAYEVTDVTTESTFRIGEIYTSFGEALMTSQRPRNLNAEELEQYDILLEEQAYPFEEKAIGIHETNIRRTTDGIYDEWIKKSLATLAKLMPVRYAKQEKGERFVAVLQ
ncbi:TPR domain protein, putative component of TonB system [hydrothermal vent metagenome]|uniref:TPR domain protein, putative component of TonB system n=1 Tax=hydrothermal vent metagenome TaxID=652676 RepID=A0A3B0Z2E4_9ZZZZ